MNGVDGAGVRESWGSGDVPPVAGEPGTVMLCWRYGQEFELTEDLHYVYDSNATMAWCPVCAAHGVPAPHLVTDTWAPFERSKQALRTHLKPASLVDTERRMDVEAAAVASMPRMVRRQQLT